MVQETHACVTRSQTGVASAQELSLALHVRGRLKELLRVAVLGDDPVCHAQFKP